jgi:hypothetical protein
MQTDLIVRTIHNDVSKNLDLTALLATVYRNNTRFRFKFVPIVSERNPNLRTSTFSLSNNDTKFTKNESEWGTYFISDVPMKQDINYFEVKMTHTGDFTAGNYVGIIDTSKPEFIGPFGLKDQICAIYLNETGNMISNTLITPYGNAKTVNGDVVGVVVNRIKDEVVFYKNGKLVGMSKDLRPSAFQDIHAFCACFFENQGQEIIEEYAYGSLPRIDYQLLKVYKPEPQKQPLGFNSVFLVFVIGLMFLGFLHGLFYMIQNG